MPYFDELFLQMLPARFDMILRIAGSMSRNQLNCTETDIEKVVISVQHGVGVDEDSPISCPYINIQSWGSEGAKPLEHEFFYEIVEIMAENLDLLTDSFLMELREIVEMM